MARLPDPVITKLSFTETTKEEEQKERENDFLSAITNMVRTADRKIKQEKKDERRINNEY